MKSRRAKALGRKHPPVTREPRYALPKGAKADMHTWTSKNFENAGYRVVDGRWEEIPLDELCEEYGGFDAYVKLVAEEMEKIK